MIDRGVDLLLTHDRAHQEAAQSSINKAKTALSWEDATSRLGARVRSDEAFSKTIAANRAYDVQAGGVLLKVNDRIVGAIGVGGARRGEDDEGCALAAVEAIQEKLNAQFSAR